MRQIRHRQKLIRRANAGYAKLGAGWVRVATAAEMRALVAELLA